MSVASSSRASRVATRAAKRDAAMEGMDPATRALIESELAAERERARQEEADAALAQRLHNEESSQPGQVEPAAPGQLDTHVITISPEPSAELPQREGSVDTDDGYGASTSGNNARAHARSPSLQHSATLTMRLAVVWAVF